MPLEDMDFFVLSYQDIAEMDEKKSEKLQVVRSSEDVAKTPNNHSENFVFCDCSQTVKK